MGFVTPPFNPAAPGAIGGTTPAAGAFTTLSASSSVTLSGIVTDLPSIASWVALFEANRQTAVADATAVSTWTDSSGNSRNATQSGGARPVYKIAANGINNQPVILFASASSQYMQTASGASSINTGDWYMCAVVKFTTNTSGQTVLAAGVETTGQRRELLLGSTISFNGYNRDVTGTAAAVAGTAYFIEVIRASGVITIYVNGVAAGSGSPTLVSHAGSALTIGGNNAGGENINASVALCGWISSAPSAFTRAQIQGYVFSVYAISISFAGEFLTKASAAGLVSYSALFDNGAEIGMFGRRFYCVSTGVNKEHVLKTNDAGHNVLKLQNLNSGSASVAYMVGSDVLDGVEGYGCAIGWGNSAISSAFASVVFLESYNSASSAFYGIRLIQTNNGVNARRMEIDAATGDCIWFDRNASTPSETETLRLLSAGGLVNRFPIRFKGYTVATLPAGTIGDNAYVTDALAPTFLATVVGGGAIKAPVFFDGTNWVGA